MNFKQKVFSNYIIASGKKMLGYKVMNHKNGKAISGADSRLNIDLKKNTVVEFPGKGIFLSLNKQYVIEHYAVHDENVIMTFEFNSDDVVFGNLTDRETEFSVSKAILKDFEILKEETVTAVITDGVTVDESTLQKASELFADEVDGIHDKKYHIVKKVDGKVVGVISFIDYKVPNDEYEHIPHKKYSRINSIVIDKDFRRKGIGKELLLFTIKHHGLVESNFRATKEGDALWKSIVGSPGISVKYNNKNPDYGHLAWTD